MLWVLHEEADKAIIGEIENQSDRGAIIVAASLLETRLLHTIRVCMRPDIPDEIYNRLFLGSAPLGSFAAKIDLGFALQLYPEMVAKFLHGIRRLRNCAAHETSATNFDFPSIRNRTLQLHSVLTETRNAYARHEHDYVIAHAKRPRQRVEALDREGNVHDYFAVHAAHDQTPREKFITSIRLMLYLLHCARDVMSS